MDRYKRIYNLFGWMVVITAAFLIPHVCFSDAPIVGRLWQLAPCTSKSTDTNLSNYESNGAIFKKKGELYDEMTYRGELAFQTAKLLTKVLHTDICVSLVDATQAIENPSWWFLLPKHLRIRELEKNKVPFHALKQISVNPSKNGTYCSNLVVRENSKIATLGDLQNKDVLVSSNYSSGSYLYPKRVLNDFFKTNHVHFVAMKKDDNELAGLKLFFSSPQYNNSAMLAYDVLLDQYEGKYKSLLKFCNIPDYVLLANDKFVSEKQRQAIDLALKNYRGKYISWIDPDMDQINRFIDFINDQNQP